MLFITQNVFNYLKDLRIFGGNKKRMKQSPKYICTFLLSFFCVFTYSQSFIGKYCYTYTDKYEMKTESEIELKADSTYIMKVIVYSSPKYGIWNHILLATLILTALMVLFVTSSFGTVFWYGLLIYGVATKKQTTICGYQ